mmetsp:Transcript_104076/g.184491  ORF Transcript_104076/g.184491 Transcript_104076/m.184491 type:complete len:277 (-) Transcript_104076:1783-2613(-)
MRTEIHHLQAALIRLASFFRLLGLEQRVALGFGGRGVFKPLREDLLQAAHLLLNVLVQIILLAVFFVAFSSYHCTALPCLATHCISLLGLPVIVQLQNRFIRIKIFPLVILAVDCLCGSYSWVTRRPVLARPRNRGGPFGESVFGPQLRSPGRRLRGFLALLRARATALRRVLASPVGANSCHFFFWTSDCIQVHTPSQIIILVDLINIFAIVVRLPFRVIMCQCGTSALPRQSFSFGHGCGLRSRHRSWIIIVISVLDHWHFDPACLSFRCCRWP